MKRLCVFFFSAAIVLSLTCCTIKSVDYLRTAKKATEGKEWINLTLSKDIYIGNEYKRTDPYQVYIHNDENNPFYVLYNTGAMCYTKVGKTELLIADNRNRELSIFLKDNNEDVFRQFVYETEQTVLNYLPFYFVGLPNKMWRDYTPMVDYINDTVANAMNCKEYVYSRNYKEFNNETGEFDVSLRKECHSWINIESHTLDSVAVFTIYDEEAPTRRYSDYFYVQSVDNEDKKTFFDSVFNFDNPSYIGYTRHTESFLPFSRTMGNAKDLNSNNLQFPLVSLSTGDTTSLANEEGWLLLDMWRFGCPGCDLGFRNLANEKDSLGYRILEHEGVKILSVNTNSDNIELLSEYAEAFRCADIIYHGKGLQTELYVNAFPSYFLISPDKQIIWRGNELGNYSELLKAKEEYDKTRITN